MAPLLMNSSCNQDTDTTGSLNLFFSTAAEELGLHDGTLHGEESFT